MEIEDGRRDKYITCSYIGATTINNVSSGGVDKRHGGGSKRKRKSDHATVTD